MQRDGVLKRVRLVPFLSGLGHKKGGFRGGGWVQGGPPKNLACCTILLFFCPLGSMVNKLLDTTRLCGSMRRRISNISSFAGREAINLSFHFPWLCMAGRRFTAFPHFLLAERQLPVVLDFPVTGRQSSLAFHLHHCWLCMTGRQFIGFPHFLLAQRLFPAFPNFWSQGGNFQVSFSGRKEAIFQLFLIFWWQEGNFQVSLVYWSKGGNFQLSQISGHKEAVFLLSLVFSSQGSNKASFLRGNQTKLSYFIFLAGRGVGGDSQLLFSACIQAT